MYAAIKVAVARLRGKVEALVQMASSLSIYVGDEKSLEPTRARFHMLTDVLGADAKVNPWWGEIAWEEFFHHDQLKSSVTRAQSVLFCLNDLVEVYGFIRQVSWYPILIEYWLQDLTGRMIPSLKYHLVWLANRGRGQAPPPRSVSIVGLDGFLIDYPFRKWCLRKMTRDISFGETLLLGVKRGMPTMGEDAVRGTCEEFMTLMSTPGSTPEWMLDEISRTVLELVPRSAESYRPQRNDVPSEKAGFEAPINVGGIRGTVYRWFVNKAKQSCMSKSLTEIYWGPHIGLVTKYDYDIIREFDLLWFELFGEWTRSVKAKTRCQLAVIFEPLKVRLITKGEPMIYALGRPLQQAVWRALKAHDVFRLTGESISTEVVCQLLRAIPEEEFHGRFDVFQSADFKDATNRMHYDVTERALRTLFPLSRELAMALTGQHRIEWILDGASTCAGRRSRWVDQVRGQLMGSLLSFPILCMVNAAVIRHAYEVRFMREFRLNELPILINGDDLAFRGDQRLVDIWRDTIGSVGFSESVGKSYTSRDWVQMNSRTFDIIRLNDRWTFGRSRPFVNFGVISGFVKGTNPQDEPDPELLSAKIRSQLSEFDDLPVAVCRRAKEVYVRRMAFRCAEALKTGKIPFALSLYNHPSVGGLGIPHESGDRVVDLEIAREAVKWKFKPNDARDFLEADSNKRKLPLNRPDTRFLSRRRRIEVESEWESARKESFSSGFWPNGRWIFTEQPLLAPRTKASITKWSERQDLRRYRG